MPQQKEIIIEPRRKVSHYWRELWLYRELFFFLAWRDILVRYKQTLIGIAWSILRPFLTMVVFTLIFGKLAGLPSNGVPYPILVFTALLPWQLFANSLADSANSLVDNAHLLSKVYFPRLIIPVSSVITALVDFVISFVILVVLLSYYSFIPNWRVLILPLFLLLGLMTSLGFGLWFAAMNVKFRDFRYVVPFILQLGLYISPVGFSSDVVPDRWRLLYSLNPMVGVIDGFRWAFSANKVAPYWPGFLFSAAISAIILLSGVRFFQSTERTFADNI